MVVAGGGGPSAASVDQGLRAGGGSDKTRFGAFVPGSSDLHDILQARGIETLIITGTATNVCCESTARDAMQMNYKVIFIADGNATNSDAEHTPTLNNMARLFVD